MPDEFDSPTLADPASLTAEERRLTDARAGVPWRAWGPYLNQVFSAGLNRSHVA